MTDHQASPKTSNRSRSAKEPAITEPDSESSIPNETPETAPAPSSPLDAASQLVEQLGAAAATAAADLERAREAFEARERELADATRAREEAEEAFSVDALPWAAVTEAIDAENRARVLMNTARRALTRASSTKDAAERAAAMGELDRCRALAGWEGLFERAEPIARRVAELTSQLGAAVDALEALREEQWSAVQRGKELTRQLGVEYDLPTKVGELYGRAVVRVVLSSAPSAPVLKPWTVPYVSSPATGPKAIASDAGLPHFVNEKGGKTVGAHSAMSDLRRVEQGLRGRWREAVLGMGDPEPVERTAPFKPSRDDSLTDGEIVRRYIEAREAELGEEYDPPPLSAFEIDGAEVVVTMPGVVFRIPFLAEHGEVRFGAAYIARGSWGEARATAPA